MARDDVASRGTPLLLEALRNPARLATLTPRDWSFLLPAAEHARLSVRVATLVPTPTPPTIPAWVTDRLRSASIRGQEFERLIAWEINRVHRALRGTGIACVFLKGAGYVAARLPIAAGRIVADIDVLVPEGSLADVESALMAHGWKQLELSAYDERYYRAWMHELPPLRHAGRGTVLDVHHAILPRTSRLQPDSKVLLASAVDHGGTLTLCPTHMVLHAAAHLFHDGEIGGALRDVIDLDGLLCHFSASDGSFWNRLVGDADELGLGRPAFYAVRYAQQLVGTPVPETFWAQMKLQRPAAPVLALMDALVTTTLSGGGTAAAASTFALYVRSHWLKMPPLMLVRHLWHQAIVR